MSDQAQFTHKSPQRLFRFSQMRRFATSEALVDPQPGEKILEFGAGDGFLVNNLATKSPETRFTIIEPFREPILAQSHFSKNVRWIRNIEECVERNFDKLVCFEVLEHLTAQTLTEFMTVCRNYLRPGGICIISMPVEVGLPALYKNALRVVFGRPHEDTTILNVLKSIFFLTNRIERIPVGGEIPGHIGFNAFETLARIKTDTDLILQKTITSPFKDMPWFLNNQLYFVFSRHT